MIPRPNERLYRAAFALWFVLLGGVVGYGISEAVTPAPSECQVMATTAEEMFDLQADLAGAVDERGDALDKDTYRIHDAEVNHLLASLAVVEVEYIDAEHACLGDS